MKQDVFETVHHCSVPGAEAPEKTFQEKVQAVIDDMAGKGYRVKDINTHIEPNKWGDPGVNGTTTHAHIHFVKEVQQ